MKQTKSQKLIFNTFLASKTIIAFLLLLAFQTISGQELKRKGLLGIMMQNVTDSIAEVNKLKNNDGVYLTTVMPNTTFSNLGVKDGDVLVSLNKQKVRNIQDLLQITSQLYEGDKLQVTYYRRGVEKNRTTSLQGKPLEKFKNANVTYGQVNYSGNQLRSILVTPKGIKNPPVVYFLQGFTCGSVETISDANPMKKLMMDWVDAGFAVFRVEKPGVGDSKSIKHCSMINFEEELRGFQEGYKALLSNLQVDQNNIFMFGHSLGGVVAPLLNNIKSPKGIMVYGTVGKNWYDYMNDLYTIQPKHWGVSASQTKEDNKINLPFNKDFLIHKKSGKELMSNAEYRNFFNGGEMDFENENYIGRHYDFWQTLADVEIQKIWSKVSTNVLAMYGEFDIQAINPKGTQKIRDIVNANGGKATFMQIPNADHGFVNFTSMRHNVNTLNNGTYVQHARDHYSKKLGKETSKWMISKLQ